MNNTEHEHESSLSKSVRLLRDYLKNAPEKELQEDWERVNAMNLKGPTLTEYLALVNPPPATPEQP